MNREQLGKVLRLINELRVIDPIDSMPSDEWQKVRGRQREIVGELSKIDDVGVQLVVNALIAGKYHGRSPAVDMAVQEMIRSQPSS